MIFNISENAGTRKPVYLDGDIRRTFLRKGGGDYKAQPQYIERMLRDASAECWGGRIFQRLSVDEAFDASSLKWYRDRYNQYNQGFDPSQPDIQFLKDWGYVIKEEGLLKPTYAAIMLFGSPRAVHQLIPRPTLDLQVLPYGTQGQMPETRWIDRFVSEVNIIHTWQQLVAKYMFFMPRPFREIDPLSLA